MEDLGKGNGPCLTRVRPLNEYKVVRIPNVDNSPPNGT